MFVSDDAGATWKLVNDDRRLRQRAFYYTRIYADPQATDTRLRPQHRLLPLDRRRQDATSAIRVPHGDNHDLWIAPNDPKRMINSNDGGANVSVNGGESWTDQDYPDRAVLQRLHDRARAVPRLRRAAGQQHGLRARAPAGGELYDVGGGESGYIAPDPADPTCSTPAATAAC